MRKRFLAWFVLLFLLLGGSVFAQESKAKPDSAQPRSAWRFQFRVIEYQNDKPINERAYSMLILSDKAETVRSGNMVPIVTNTTSGMSTQYITFGLRIVCSVEELDSRVSQSHIEFEVASLVGDQKGAGGNPLVRSVSGSSTFVVHPGQREVVIKADDVNTDRRFEVEVLATRVN
jgi:hypothetical protein